MKQAGINQIIVRTKKTHNDEASIVNESGENVSLFLDTAFNPEQHAIIHGEVVATPIRLSAREITRRYVGYPIPHPTPPTNIAPEILSLTSLPVEVTPETRVYFHFLGYDMDNFLGEKDGYKYFAIDYDRVFCMVQYKYPIDRTERINEHQEVQYFNPSNKTPVITPICGHILVQPFWGDDIQEFELPQVGTGFAPLPKSIKGKINSLGLITDISEEPKFLEGIVKHIGRPCGLETVDIAPGDHILYTTDSDFENEIEGEKYFVMKRWDVFAKVVDGKIIPQGTWVAIKPDEVKTPSGLILIEKKKVKGPTWGEVITIGPDVSEFKIKDRVLFQNASSSRIEFDGLVYVREDDVFVKAV